MSDNWIYDHDEPKARYSLGEEGDNPLVCFGVNPSTAVPGNLDPTVASVARFAEARGYDGWLMFNLYPQRATNPDKMHKRFQKQLHLKNVDAIEEWVSGKSLDVWCAWGTLIEKRDYLSRCLSDIYEVLDGSGCTYFKRGRISKAGHPHHPLYLKKTAPPEVFDLDGYVRNL
ncbi:DUF1643 domain-containing protein [Gracilimonas mengyeensis]|uniref:DUF1643 domain-containing protein n=1 Tax=Gracilimonas mengyeensis TaxID=1302730 RepID=A0A521BV89_9BACT|nr:DUF1643 domain-containing protein [Gracilimonas mengyeensis]SMO51112.1 hypothetical protein SAMN06265219_103142 [Gracilimonas mengyeensis]